MAGAWLHCVACAWLVQEVGEEGGRSWRRGRQGARGWLVQRVVHGLWNGCCSWRSAGEANCVLQQADVPSLPHSLSPPPPQIVLGNDHISFATTKLGSLLQVQSSKDPEGLRVFYYLVQVRLVFSALLLHWVATFWGLAALTAWCRPLNLACIDSVQLWPCCRTLNALCSP